jgi:hypothetical protein
MIRRLLIFLLILPGTALAKEPIQHVLSETEVKKAIIAESINAYPGNCPCPYNSARSLWGTERIESARRIRPYLLRERSDLGHDCGMA